MIKRAALVVALILVAGACSGDDGTKATVASTTTAPATTSTAATSTAAPYAGYTSKLYARPSSWLCRPDMDDVCDKDLDATSIAADGTTTPDAWTEATHPSIDCF